MLRALAILVVLTLAACAPEADPASPVLAEPAADASPAVGSVVATDEAFADFFARFQADTAFQRTRLADGFTSSYFDTDGMEPTRVEERTYTPQPLAWTGPESVRTSFATDDAGGGSDTPEGVDPAAEAVEYRLQGTDNGVSLHYRFVRGADGLWRLAAVDDHSM